MSISQAVDTLRKGGVIAYPTEAVYGLGCDPDNEAAVRKILRLKQRDISKGLIIIASDVSQLDLYIDHQALINNPDVITSWPGPHTWLIPCKTTTPNWLTGEHNTLAVRVTAHPVAAQLCQLFGKAIVSTSANVNQEPPAQTANEIREIFSDGIDCIIEGETGGHNTVTSITDAVTGKALR